MDSRYKERLFPHLEWVQKFAEASKWQRLLKQPWRYLHAMSFNHFIYPFTKNKIKKTRTLFTGQSMQVLLPASTDIFLAGAKTHPSEIRLARFLIQELQAGDCFWDIGSHFGYFTLLAAELVGGNGHVIAVEPAPQTFQVLKANTQTLKNVEVYHKAISDKLADIVFYEFPVLYSEYNSFVIDQYKNEDWFEKNQPQAIEMQTITLDHLYHKTKDRTIPKIIKIDVEGAELFAVNGSKALLSNEDVYFILEFVVAERDNIAHKKAQQQLIEMGYQAFTINELGLLETVSDIEAYLLKVGLESDNIVFKKTSTE